MDRRGFLSLIGLGVGGVVIDQAIPLGRMWSFPKNIVIAQRPGIAFETGLGEEVTVRTAYYRWGERTHGFYRTTEIRQADGSWAPISLREFVPMKDFPIVVFPQDSSRTPN
jgi:hypothetical protein